MLGRGNLVCKESNAGKNPMFLRPEDKLCVQSEVGQRDYMRYVWKGRQKLAHGGPFRTH